MPVKRVDPFAQEVKAWFVTAMKGADGQDRMSYADLKKKSGVAATTLYRMRDGEGGEVTQRTLDLVAEALGVEAPAIFRSLAPSESAREMQDPMAVLGKVEHYLGVVRLHVEALTSAVEGEEESDADGVVRRKRGRDDTLPPDAGQQGAGGE